MVPAMTCNKLYDVGDSIAYIRFNTTRTASQPVENDCAVCLCVHSLEWETENSIDTGNHIKDVMVVDICGHINNRYITKDVFQGCKMSIIEPGFML